MSAAENKRRWLEWIDALNRGDMAQIDTYFAPNFTWGDFIQNREEFKRVYAEFIDAFHDGYWEIEDVIAEDDKVVTLATVHVTFHGEYMGIPPTGQRISWKEINIDRWANGQIVERTFLMADEAARLQQLGAIPPDH